MVAFARWIRASDRQSPLNTENLSIVLYIPPPKRPTHAAHPHLPPPPPSSLLPPPSSLPIYLPAIIFIPTPTKTSHQPLHIINHKRRYNTNSISQRSPLPPKKKPQPSHLHRTTLTQIKQHTPHKNLLHRRVRFLFAGGELRFAGGRLGCCVCALAGCWIVVFGGESGHTASEHRCGL